MKTLNQKLRSLCLTVCVMCSFILLQAQESQKFLVHEDVVYPSKITEYEAVSKTFAETMEQQDATDAAFLAVTLDDHRYLYVSAIEDYAALDMNPFEKLAEEMGEEFENMMSKYDGTFESHKNYVISLSHDLSYNSQDIVMDGVDFRHFTYWYITPGKLKEAKAMAQEWKELYAAKGIEPGYRVYTGGLGADGEMIMVVGWAESAEQYYAQRAKTRAALGDVSDIMNRTHALTRKMESFDGMIRSDLSYQPKSAMAEN